SCPPSGARYTEMLSQSASLILGSGDPAASQLRDNELDEIVESSGKIRSHDVEFICSLCPEPLFHHVGDLASRSFHSHADSEPAARTASCPSVSSSARASSIHGRA